MIENETGRQQMERLIAMLDESGTNYAKIGTELCVHADDRELVVFPSADHDGRLYASVTTKLYCKTAEEVMALCQQGGGA